MTDQQWNNPYPGGQPQPNDPRFAPSAGYTIPGQPQQPGYDPLISLDYSGWWRRGIAIVKQGWKPLAALQGVGLVIALVIQAPVAVYVALQSEELEQFVATEGQAAPDFGPLFAVLGFTLLLALIGIILTAMITVATVHIGVSVAVGAPLDVGAALKLALRRVFPLLGWQILAIPIYIVALCLCILPIFYIAAVFTVLPVVVAVERTNAIGRCFSLFHANFGPAAGRAFTIVGMSIGVNVVAAIFGSVIDAVARNASDGTTGVVVGSIISSFLGAVIAGALAVLIAPLILTTYADIRARVEPLNSAMIAQQLGIGVPVSAWPTSPPPTAPPASPYPPQYPQYPQQQEPGQYPQHPQQPGQYPPGPPQGPYG
jgi:hypothetical protein